MRHKTLLRTFVILLMSLQTEAAAPPKNSPPSIPQDDFADPFGDGGFNLEDGPPSGDGPPQLPGEEEMGPPKKGGQKGAPSGKAPTESDFSDDFGPLPPDAGMPADLPPLPEEKAQKEEAPVPAKEEVPSLFSWGSIDLHNLAKQAGGRIDVAGRKADTYRA